jgi:hypothetical protein
LTDAMGVAGAALIISNKRTGNVDEALAPDSSPTTSGTTPLSTRTRHCSTEAGKNSPNVFRTSCYGRASGTTILY